MPLDPEPRIDPIEWRAGVVRFIDQTRLPGELVFVDTADWRDVADAIRRLAVRGAPLIGIAGAYGLALAARRPDVDLREVADALIATRPTAVNLRWAVERALEAGDGLPEVRARAIEAEAARIHERQVLDDERMGEFGAALMAPGSTVLTHCNAGGLATGGIGTALGVVKTAHRQGKRIRVLADETRPLLQGARLTAWELAREGVPHSLIVDGAAGTLRPAAVVTDPVSGRSLEMRVTAPGIQFYTGNFLDGTFFGKSARAYRQGDAICLEPGVFPDSPNHADFPSARLNPGQTYVNTMVYKFGTR